MAAKSGGARNTQKKTIPEDDVTKKANTAVVLGEKAKAAIEFLDEWLKTYTQNCFNQFRKADPEKLAELQGKLLAAENFRNEADMAIRSGNRAAKSLM